MVEKLHPRVRVIYEPVPDPDDARVVVAVALLLLLLLVDEREGAAGLEHVLQRVQRHVRRADQLGLGRRVLVPNLKEEKKEMTFQLRLGDEKIYEKIYL